MNSNLLEFTTNSRLQVYLLAPKRRFVAQNSKVQFTSHFWARFDINIFLNHYNQLNQLHVPKKS